MTDQADDDLLAERVIRCESFLRCRPITSLVSCISLSTCPIQRRFISVPDLRLLSEAENASGDIVWDADIKLAFIVNLLIDSMRSGDAGLALRVVFRLIQINIQ